MTRDEERQYHKAFGQHSRIPSCCIDFFVDKWDMLEGWRNEGNWYHQAVAAANFGYIPCPQCLGTGNKVEIKLCAIECHGDHFSAFEIEDEHELDGVEDGRG